MSLNETIATFPSTFKLRAFPGETFRIEHGACYTRSNGEHVLYVYRKSESCWLAFSKGTVSELRSQIL